MIIKYWGAKMKNIKNIKLEVSWTQSSQIISSFLLASVTRSVPQPGPEHCGVETQVKVIFSHPNLAFLSPLTLLEQQSPLP